MITEREIEIIHELQVRVLEYEKTLTECIRVSAELDWYVLLLLLLQYNLTVRSLMALAEAASKYKYTRPTMTTQNILEIEKGRHPLQELCVPSYVENPTFLVGGAGDPPFSNSPTPTPTPEGPSTLLLTGPNYSGKSVYLKQVALIVYMAHIGSFVPASNATIGITDAILTRIQTRESVSKVQSAFMIDLQQISLMLRVCTARSLLIIDEFGKGTSSSDGAGLACAVFEHLLSLAENNPKVLGATHYHEIFEHGFLLDYPALSLGHMRVLLDDAAQLPEGQITYLYKLEPGRKGSSFGTMCAVLNGIEESVVARADDLILLMARGEDLVAACARLTDEERGELEIAEISVRRFLQEFGDDEEEEEEEEDGEGAETTRARLERALRS